MPSAVDAMAAADAPAFMDVFGETEMIDVVPFGSSLRSIPAIILRETYAPLDLEQRGNAFNSMEIYIRSSDNVVGIVNPGQMKVDGTGCDHYPAIDGKSWRCQRVLERNVGGMHKLLLHDGGS